MSDDLNDDYGYDDGDDTADEQPKRRAADQDDTEPGWRTRLKNKAKTATERAEAAERKLAFLEAGIDPKTDKRLTFFMDGYKGDLTPEAVKAAAIDAGFIDADDEADDIPAEERQAHERMTATTTGAGSNNQSDAYAAAIADAKAAGQTQRVIELRQQQAAAARAQAR